MINDLKVRDAFTDVMVFAYNDLNKVGSVDLVKSSKAQRTDQDSAEFGTFYFRYYG